jgi:DNA-binding NarL/FixJ family response regulator
VEMTKLDDKTVNRLKQALDALETPDGCVPVAALGPLGELADGDRSLTIDYAASAALGAPVILAGAEDAVAALLTPLSPRRRAVAEAVIRGLSNKQIARELDISPATVKDHVHAVLTSLGFSSRAGLIAAALSRKS